MTALLDQPGAIGLALRLRDRFGDHGVVGVVLPRPDGADLRVDTWLMSCRVLGRVAEVVTMRVLADEARSQGRRLLGKFLPTQRNAPAARAYADCDETTAGDVPGWDSMAHVNLMFSTEPEFGIAFNSSELSTLQDVGELRRVVADKLGR